MNASGGRSNDTALAMRYENNISTNTEINGTMSAILYD